MKTIKTYNDLQKHICAFSKRKMNLLFILSRGGLGKTTLVEEALIKDDPLIFKGHITPLHLYKQIYLKNEEEKNFLLLLDDVDSLLSNKINITLLKQICETKENKEIYYNSTTPLIKDIKPKFETSCKVIVLLNDIETFSENNSLKALLTRAHLIYFDPTPGEIINYMQSYAKDKNILDFIEKYSQFSNTLSLRTYEKAKELKESKLNWQDEILTSMEIDKRLFEIDILLKKYKTDKLRITHFSGSRMTYYRYKKKFLEHTKI
jgi:hypothetical protein